MGVELCKISKTKNMRIQFSRMLLAIFALSQLIYLWHISVIEHRHSSVSGQIEHVCASHSEVSEPITLYANIDKAPSKASDNQELCLVCQMASNHTLFLIPEATSTQLPRPPFLTETQVLNLERTYLSWSLLRVAPKNSPPCHNFV